ncbi:N6-adenosine-specific RNA methylase IME4 [Xanthobacter sp. SG618]|uniref:MT-A70 family methyltransferase n=1 Tax=Xanthobacter sp. SG618 TaxID=2587121 RepID=UPI00184A9215|nr:MT-A70 family methyltransferase [Xanthobacter sp. SG618]NMN56883.1 N6-adenosine-specific RNA methylase IME4 [Xanthobacter sp. SG618]
MSMDERAWQFGSLRMFGYDVIEADLPWDFALYSEAGEAKCAKAHYVAMSFDAIAALRVGDLARGDCLLLSLCCEWVPPAGRQAVLDPWGFTYKASLICRKTTASGKVAMGPRYRARTMHEPILLATMGNPRHQPFLSMIDGLASGQSRMPEEFYATFIASCPATHCADFFALHVPSSRQEGLREDNRVRLNRNHHFHFPQLNRIGGDYVPNIHAMPCQVIARAFICIQKSGHRSIHFVRSDLTNKSFVKQIYNCVCVFNCIAQANNKYISGFECWGSLRVSIYVFFYIVRNSAKYLIVVLEMFQPIGCDGYVINRSWHGFCVLTYLVQCGVRPIELFDFGSEWGCRVFNQFVSRHGPDCAILPKRDCNCHAGCSDRKDTSNECLPVPYFGKEVRHVRPRPCKADTKDRSQRNPCPNENNSIPTFDAHMSKLPAHVLVVERAG